MIILLIIAYLLCLALGCLYLSEYCQRTALEDTLRTVKRDAAANEQENRRIDKWLAPIEHETPFDAHLSTSAAPGETERDWTAEAEMAGERR